MTGHNNNSTLAKQRLISIVLTLTLIATLALAVGCANKNLDQEDVLATKKLSSPPSYKLLARSLGYYERKLNVDFYRNDNGVYTPFSIASWDNFTISDRLGACLFDVQVIGLRNFRNLDGRRQVLLDLEITEGPCNLQYPDTDLAASDLVSSMEGTVISPRLIDKLDSHGMCSDRHFLEEVLQMPYKLQIAGDDVEGSIVRVAQRVENPLDLRFGDVIFFSPYPEETTSGIYVGYGLLVYNSCFGGRSHKLQEGEEYRIYRMVIGFDWTRYRMHQEKFLDQFVGIPE
ncbi:MAG: hypothetical protein P9M14_06330 [Candidatus Alcyoniella australis]|nr:hypothetical protein [Candidatus Alcyoniella australis]